MKKYIKLSIRLIISVSLIFYLFYKVDIIHVANSLILINPLFFLLASFLYILSSYISTLRWKIFISNSELTTSKLFSIYLIGSFFNIALPGTVGGDIVKVFMIKEKTGVTEALASVFIERYTGLAALLIIGFGFFCLFYGEIPKQPLIWTVPLSFFAFIIGTAFLLWISNFKFFKTFRDYILSFQRKQIIQALVYSLGVQIIVILSVYVIFIGLNLSISFFKVAIFLPIIILITMLPISISGTGVREWCFILFFSNSLGQANVVAVSILWFLSQVLASLVGGVEYLRLNKPLNIKKE
ncbi:MAG TPA: lysylphosphatidylglycerol synthase transmembrane domain-containing protein [Thermodesulfovibrio thiophilus]|nr:lysylphosphatidylglycerol synthase transmembrane domain-containing protein [Thermodesulfovibrio thiophilus]